MRQNLRPSTLSLQGLILITFCYVTSAHADFQSLQNKYQELAASLNKNPYGVPIYIESIGSKDSQQGNIYGVLFHPFARVKQSLSQAVNWCEIAPQHINIKACTYRKLNGSCQLTLYSGRKYFERPEDAYMLDYIYSASSQQPNFLQVQLVADDGPLGTSNYKIITEAIPLDDNSTFIKFSYSYDQGFWTRAAMGTYLATLGRDKVGFSVVGTDEHGAAIYIDGVRGVIERNAIRYYYAIKSYLDTAEASADTRFLARLNRWYELTEKHHTQLYEMDKKDYLEYKQKERVEQLRLQEIINKTMTGCPLPAAEEAN